MKTKLRRSLLIGAPVAVLALAALLFVLLRGPGLKAPADPLELMSARCDAVVVVPQLGRLGERLAILPRLKLAQVAASLRGFPSAEVFIDQLSRAAGLDLRSRESIRAAGIDPDRQLVVFKPQGAGPLAALPVAEREKLEAYLAHHAEARLAARTKGSLEVEGGKVVTWSQDGRPAPALSYAVAGSYLLVAAGEPGLQALKAALVQPSEGSLGKDPRFAGLRQRLGSSEAFAYACPGSDEARQLARAIDPFIRGASLAVADLPYGAGASLSLSATEAKLSLDVPLAEGQAAALASLKEPGGAQLLEKLDPKAFFVARLGLDPKVLVPHVQAIAPRILLRALKQSEIAPADALSALQPGMALSLSLAPTADLGNTPALDFARTNPFRYVHLQALGRAPETDQARALFEKLIPNSSHFGAQIAQSDVAGTPAYTFNYQLGEGASIAFKDGLAVVTGGPGQMQAQLERLAQPGAALDPAAKAALEQGGIAFWLDVKRLVAAVRELPDSAYGIGGFAIKPAVERWLTAVEEITSVRLKAGVEEGALRAELALTLKPAEGAAVKEPKQ